MAAEGESKEQEAEAPAEAPLTPEQRLDRLERGMGTRTYAGAAALVLALAGAIVAVVLAVDARDNSATKSQLNQLERQLGGVADDASAGIDLGDSVSSLEEQVQSLQSELDGISSSDDSVDKRISVVEDDIEDLRQQISDLDQGPGGDAGGGGGGGGASNGDDG